MKIEQVIRRFEVALVMLLYFSSTGAILEAGQSIRISREAEVHKHEILMGEPLIIRAGIRNKLHSDISVFLRNGPGIDGRSHAVPVVTGHRQREIWNHDLFHARWRIGPSLLTRNSSIDEYMIVMYHRRDGFVHEGEKLLNMKVEWVVHDGVSTQSIFEDLGTIVITDVDREQDVEAWKLLKSRKSAYGILIHVPFQFDGPRLTAQDRSFFENFVREHRNSQYAEYVALSLGRHYLAIADHSKGTVDSHFMKAVESAEYWLKWVIMNGNNRMVQELAKSRLEVVEKMMGE